MFSQVDKDVVKDMQVAYRDSKHDEIDGADSTSSGEGPLTKNLVFVRRYLPSDIGSIPPTLETEKDHK